MYVGPGTVERLMPTACRAEDRDEAEASRPDKLVLESGPPSRQARVRRGRRTKAHAVGERLSNGYVIDPRRRSLALSRGLCSRDDDGRVDRGAVRVGTLRGPRERRDVRRVSAQAGVRDCVARRRSAKTGDGRSSEELSNPRPACCSTPPAPTAQPLVSR